MAKNSTQTAQLQYLNSDGKDIFQLVGQGGNVQVALTASGAIQAAPILIAASGPVSPFVAGVYVITLGSAAALTLAAPTAGVDDGNEISITSSTAFAHTLTTAAGNLKTGVTGSHSVITFPAFIGGSVTLMAYQANWYIQFMTAATVTT